jgi:hypothetical protein
VLFATPRSDSILKRLKIVMKKFNDSYFAAEQYDFKPFSEDDLAMVMGAARGLVGQVVEVILAG